MSPYLIVALDDCAHCTQGVKKIKSVQQFNIIVKVVASQICSEPR